MREIKRDGDVSRQAVEIVGNLHMSVGAGIIRGRAAAGTDGRICAGGNKGADGIEPALHGGDHQRRIGPRARRHDFVDPPAGGNQQRDEVGKAAIGGEVQGGALDRSTLIGVGTRIEQGADNIRAAPIDGRQEEGGAVGACHIDRMPLGNQAPDQCRHVGQDGTANDRIALRYAEMRAIARVEQCEGAGFMTFPDRHGYGLRRAGRHRRPYRPAAVAEGCDGGREGRVARQVDACAVHQRHGGLGVEHLVGIEAGGERFADRGDIILEHGIEHGIGAGGCGVGSGKQGEGGIDRPGLFQRVLAGVLELRHGIVEQPVGLLGEALHDARLDHLDHVAGGKDPLVLRFGIGRTGDGQVVAGIGIVEHAQRIDGVFRIVPEGVQPGFDAGTALTLVKLGPLDCRQGVAFARIADIGLPPIVFVARPGIRGEGVDRIFQQARHPHHRTHIAAPVSGQSRAGERHGSLDRQHLGLAIAGPYGIGRVVEDIHPVDHLAGRAQGRSQPRHDADAVFQRSEHPVEAADGEAAAGQGGAALGSRHRQGPLDCGTGCGKAAGEVRRGLGIGEIGDGRRDIAPELHQGIGAETVAFSFCGQAQILFGGIEEFARLAGQFLCRGRCAGQQAEGRKACCEPYWPDCESRHCISPSAGSPPRNSRIRRNLQSVNWYKRTSAPACQPARERLIPRHDRSALRQSGSAGRNDAAARQSGHRRSRTRRQSV